MVNRAGPISYPFGREQRNELQAMCSQEQISKENVLVTDRTSFRLASGLIFGGQPLYGLLRTVRDLGIPLVSVSPVGAITLKENSR